MYVTFGNSVRQSYGLIFRIAKFFLFEIGESTRESRFTYTFGLFTAGETL